MERRRRGVTPTSDTKEVVKQIVQRKNKPIKEIERVEFISSGSTPLNLAASQKARNGGWGRNRIINFVGDRSSGKTLLALEAAAQIHYYIKNIKSTLFPPVKNIKIKYWNREGVMDFPLEQMYGESLVEAIDWNYDCIAAEQWGRDVFRCVNEHKPGECFLGILDTIDSLGTEAGKERLDKSVKSNKPMDGTYGTGVERAKYFSSDFFNNLCSRMRSKDFTLILISQVRDKIDANKFEKKQYRAGGKALDFYAHQVAWLSSAKKLENKYDEQKRAYGIAGRAFFDKNKVAPPYRSAVFNILFNYGLDDIGSMAHFLSSARIQKVFKEQFDKQVTREELIDAADNDKGIYEQLIDAMEEYWREIEANTAVTRNPRFP